MSHTRLSAVTVTTGQKLTGVSVKMQQGQNVKVQIKDSSKTLGTKDVKGAPRSVQVRLHGPAGTHPRILDASQPNPDGQTHELVVPAGFPMQVKVDGPGIKVADSNGFALAKDKADDSVKFPKDPKQPAVHVYQISAK